MKQVIKVRQKPEAKLPEDSTEPVARGPVAQPIGFGEGAVKLKALSSFRIDDEIEAVVRGIRVGGQYLRGTFQTGSIIEIPVNYLPWVELPSPIRFVSKQTELEFCPPIVLRAQDDASALLGSGDFVVNDLSLRDGMVRGSAINRKNGLAHAQLYARVNGRIPRSLTIERPRMLDDGGAITHFALQLFPTDITDQGLSVEIFEQGSAAPLTSTVLARVNDGDLRAKIIEFQTQLEEIRSSTAHQIRTIAAQNNERLGTLQERIDHFIEYMTLHLLDGKASVRRASAESVSGGHRPLPDSISKFKDLVYAAGVRSAQHSNPDRAQRVITARSEAFSYGWYDVETDERTDFRWMGQSGLLFNPEPDRPVESVTIDVHMVYGAEHPALRAFLDHVPAKVLVEEDRKDHRYRIIVSWPAGQQAAGFKVLRLESDVAVSPAIAEGSQDDRTLSLAVAQITFG